MSITGDNPKEITQTRSRARPQRYQHTHNRPASCQKQRLRVIKKEPEEETKGKDPVRAANDLNESATKKQRPNVESHVDTELKGRKGSAKHARIGQTSAKDEVFDLSLFEGLKN